MPGSILNPKTGRVQQINGVGGSVGSTLIDAFANFEPNTKRANDELLQRTLETSFPKLPQVASPALFSGRTPYPESESLSSAMGRMDDPMPASAQPASRGITYEGPSDFSADRGAFLSRGSSPEIGQMADAMQARANFDTFETGGVVDRRNAQEREQLALQGLRNSRQGEAQRLDPGFARQNRALDRVSDAETYMNPALQRQRDADLTQDVGRAEAMQDVDISGKTDPRMLGMLFQKFLQDRELHKIDASGRNPFGAMGMGMGGDASGGGGIPQGSRMGEQKRLRDGRVATWDGQGWYVDE